MPRKTEKRRKSRKNRSQKNRTEKRKIRGGSILDLIFGKKKDETKPEGETEQVNPLIKKEGIKDESKEEPKKEEVRKPEPVESSQPGQEKKGLLDWLLKPKPKEPVPPAPSTTGGKRRRNRNKKQ